MMELTKSPMELIKFNLERQNEQGLALVEMIKNVEKIESNVELKFAEMKTMVQEVKETVTITYEQQKELQSKVFKTSNELAKETFIGELFDPAEKEFKEEVGKFRRAIWKKLKEKMNVPRYTSIRKIDYELSMEFVSNLRMKDFLQI